MKNVNVYHKMKNANVHHKMEKGKVHHYLFLSETYEPVARDTCPPPPPFGQNYKKLDF